MLSARISPAGWHDGDAGEQGDEINLDRGTTTAGVESWIGRVASGVELVILEAPPLDESIDAALLSSASDGLVIVAEPEVTERATLQAAAERARAAGCHTLGVVLSGRRQHMPAWLRRFMNGHGRP